MYTIANIIYGFDLTEKVVIDPEDIDINSDDSTVVVLSRIAQEIENNNNGKESGFVQYYSGSADFEPTAFGIRLCRFDECDNVKISSLILTPNAKKLQEFNTKFKALHPDIKKYFKDMKPESFILWSTS